MLRDIVLHECFYHGVRKGVQNGQNEGIIA